VRNNNSEGVSALLDSPLIPCLLWTLEAASSIAMTLSCTEDIVDVQRNICLCINECVFHTFEQTRTVVNYGSIPPLIKLLETHIEEMKQNKKKMDEEVIENASKVLIK
jgi:hypothetical protein